MEEGAEGLRPGGMAAGVVAILFVVALIVFWIFTSLGVESAGGGGTRFVFLGVLGVLIVGGSVCALVVVAIRSKIGDLQDAADRRRKMPAAALEAMMLYFVATCTDERCRVDADRRLTGSDLEIGYGGMPPLVDASDGLAPGKLSALNTMKNCARHLTAQDRHALVRAAVMMFLGDERYSDVKGFREVTSALGPLSGDALRVLQQPSAAGVSSASA